MEITGHTKCLSLISEDNSDLLFLMLRDFPLDFGAESATAPALFQPVFVCGVSQIHCNRALATPSSATSGMLKMGGGQSRRHRPDDFLHWLNV